uniref:cGMP-dependent protein kinase n=1 Tax=Octactis speculum TaxID=3111310 RepID=A0A7S2FKJ3_9STRA|mmetsp:Transcript_24279/g.33272  ORF Transcript_24279/g.33272 Transcript_24279/m.33272 type:complete len:769 (+) Transcript_24279:49-2355(+)
MAALAADEIVETRTERQESADVLDGGADMTEPQRVHALRIKRQVRNVFHFFQAEDSSDAAPQPTEEKSPESIEVIKSALSRNLLLNSLTETEVDIFIKCSLSQEVPAGTTIINHGEDGDYFYIVETGLFEVFTPNASAAVCSPGPGDTFGELAILCNAPRAATVTAKENSLVWKIERDQFRNSMAAATNRHLNVARDCLKRVELLADLSESARDTAANAASVITYKAGATIITKGDTGSIFYMIAEGTVQCRDLGTEGVTLDLGVNAYFGERSLVTNDVRSATVVALTDVTLMALAREDFEKLLGPLQDQLAKDHDLKVLETTEFLSKLSPEERDHAASKFITHEFPDGANVVKQGTPCTSFFIVKEGQVQCIKNNQPTEILEVGKEFNLEAMLDVDRLCEFTVVAIGDVKCFELHRSDLAQVMSGELSNLVHSHSQRLVEQQSSRFRVLEWEDLSIKAVLGAGTFGRVKLVQSASTGDVFALKTLHKKEVVMHKQQQNVMNEKNIMIECNHPFILSLYQTYKDAYCLHMLLEYCNGGELFTVLHTRTRDGVPPASAKFYCAGVLLALGYLLRKNISYRDLKPENMLVDALGYVKIIDFGFAKTIKGSTRTVCGTPEYMAPEILLGRGYNIQVDWWAFGVLLYECLAGYSPFAGSNADDQSQIFRNITSLKYRFSKRFFDDDAVSVVKSLLVLDPKNRITAGPEGSVPLEAHPWFADIDMEKMIQKEIVAPWVPVVTDPLDTRNFDPYGVDDTIDRSYVDSGNWDAEF